MSMVTKNDQNAIPEFGPNEGYWIYTDYSGEIIGAVVRYKKIKNGKPSKDFRPWTYINNQWSKGWYDENHPLHSNKPPFNAPSLKEKKPVLIVEGEKTAQKAQELLPEFSCITFMGGASGVNKMDLTYLKGKTVCIWPDNDEPGIKAANTLKERLKPICSKIGVVNVSSLSLEPKWDLGDFDDDHGTIDLDTVRLCIDSSMQARDEFDLFSYPNLTGSEKNPRPLDTLDNFRHLLSFFDIDVRWNMMKRTREVIIPDVSFYNEEQENHSLNYITDLAVMNQFPIRRIDKHLDHMAWDNVYHPIRDWILATPLKETGIIDQFISLIPTSNDELSYILIKRWLISAIAVLFNEGNFCSQGVLVLQGESGTHKSSFLMDLVPSHFRAIRGGMSIDPSRKDDILTSCEYWIAELGELDATFRKADIAKLKQFITNNEDDTRRPYAKRNSKLTRRTIFAATVNEDRFLVDTTGNRRWWTIKIIDKIKTRTGIDMQQVWREAYELYLKGESPILLEHELVMLNEFNKDYEFVDPLQEKLDLFYDWDYPERIYMTCTEILMEMGHDKPTKLETTRISNILRQRKTPQGQGKLRYSYLMPISRFNKTTTQP